MQTTPIDPEVRERLVRNIISLLNAHWNTSRIRDTLSRESSFGKHLGCTPAAIEEIAIAECRRMNAENRRQYNECVREAKASLNRYLAELGR